MKQINKKLLYLALISGTLITFTSNFSLASANTNKNKKISVSKKNSKINKKELFDIKTRSEKYFALKFAQIEPKKWKTRHNVKIITHKKFEVHKDSYKNGKPSTFSYKIPKNKIIKIRESIYNGNYYYLEMYNNKYLIAYNNGIKFIK